MRGIGPQHLAQVGRCISEAPGGAVSLTTLAKRLGTSYPTARRRLHAYAKSKGLELVSVETREGKRGRTSAAWYLRPITAPEETPSPSPLRPSGVEAPRRLELPPLDLPAACLTALTPDEQRALRYLRFAKTARTSDLVAHLGLSAALVDGLMREVRSTLHAHRQPHFTDEQLPSGETLFRLAQPEVKR